MPAVAATPSAADVPPTPARFFDNLERQHGFEPVEIQGTLPASLTGTLYRNGPGIFEQFGSRYDHFVEGDGAISAVRFSQGRALAAARVIDSAGLIEERAAGRHLNSFRAPWPTRFHRLHRGRFKNTANTNVVFWQNKLYALNEGSRPTALDPESLATLGETDLDGVVAARLSAHPHRVAKRRASYNFGMRYGKDPALLIYALPDRGPAQRLASVPLDRSLMLHDFIANDKYLVFLLSPLRIIVWRMLLALRPFTANFRWAPEDGTEVIVVPIDHPDNPIRFRTEPFCQFHFAGAFTDRGEIVVDYVRYPDSQVAENTGDGSAFSWADIRTTAHGTLHRARINLRQKTLRSAPLWDGHCEYPQILPASAGGRYRSIWLQSAYVIDGILRYRISRVEDNGAACHYTCEPGEICSEPVLSHGPHDRERDGSVLTLVYNSYSARSHVMVLDAHSLRPQARIQLAQAIPMTFHGCWRPA